MAQKGQIIMPAKKPRKDRSDITVGTLEKKHGMPPGTIRNPDGRDTRSDKKLGTIRERSAKKTSKQASEPTSPKRAAKTPQIEPPQCALCGKAVEGLIVLPHPHDPSKSIVEYQCHGELASQEISSSELADKRGLSSYTVFNAFTSGMMPGKPPKSETVKKRNGG